MSPRIVLSPYRGFAAADAPDTELAARGLPTRPMGGADNPLRRRWDQVFGGERTVRTATSARPPPRWPRGFQPSPINGDQSPNWSGVVVEPQDATPALFAIAGTWTVPQLRGVSDTTDYVSIWVGLGGNLPSSANPNLLQAGVTGSVDPNGNVAFNAWSEWLSLGDVAPPQPLDLPVAAGDVLETQIWVTSSTTATVVMQNHTNPAEPDAVLIPLVAPAGVGVSGYCGEWIVERPALVDGSSVTYYTLAGYSPPVVFTDAAAWTGAESGLELSFSRFAQHAGFSRPVHALSVAAARGFVAPVSMRALMSEVSVVDASSGSTLTMEDNGMAVSIGTIVGSEVRCAYRSG